MKKNWKKIIIVVMCIMMIVAGLCMTVNAKSNVPRNGKYIDSQGYIYIMKHGKPRTGWFKYHGKVYYGHKTKSACYPKGSVAQNTFRVRHNRMYYFNNKGEKITKSTRYIGLRKGRTSVHYVYMPGSRWERYNAKHRRFQYLDRRTGKWRDMGMQVYPYGWIDWQE